MVLSMIDSFIESSVWGILAKRKQCIGHVSLVMECTSVLFAGYREIGPSGHTALLVWNPPEFASNRAASKERAVEKSNLFVQSESPVRRKRRG